MPISHGRTVDLPSGPQDPPDYPQSECPECGSANTTKPEQDDFNKWSFECLDCGEVTTFKV